MPRDPAVNRLIAALRLEALPGEGGFFRPTWRSATTSAIYFLLTREDFSALHRLVQDEMWHFYAGDPCEHVQIDPSTGKVRRLRMGSNVLAGDQVQVLVPAGCWQGARIDPSVTGGQGFALFGCTVSPPWDEKGFTLANRAELTRELPAHAELIRQLTR